MSEARRRVPRTDDVLADPALAQPLSTHGRDLVKQAVRQAQQEVREGSLDPAQVPGRAAALLPSVHELTPVLNATGIVVHTNLGRAPLSAAARVALADAAGTVDLEVDLDTGRRSTNRGAGAQQAVLGALDPALVSDRPDLDVLIVGNGAAALVLCATAFAAGAQVILSRGEMVEIGAGFRLTDLLTSTGAQLREVGTTNRTHARDYAEALGEGTGLVLKVHPANYRLTGFTGAADTAALREVLDGAGHQAPLVVDVGSGLLRPDPALPDEPDVTSALAQGADLVTCSGDKLLGGPQAGLVVGRADLVARLRRFPLARALRVDKLTLAALEATLRGPEPPVTRARRLTRADLRPRTEALAARLGAQVVEVVGHVGGGGAPGVELPGLALALPGDAERLALALRTATPAVLARVHRGRCLIDLRCIDPADDGVVAEACLRAQQRGDRPCE